MRAGGAAAGGMPGRTVRMLEKAETGGQFLLASRTAGVAEAQGHTGAAGVSERWQGMRHTGQFRDDAGRGALELAGLSVSDRGFAT